MVTAAINEGNADHEEVNHYTLSVINFKYIHRMVISLWTTKCQNITVCTYMVYNFKYSMYKPVI